MKIPYYGLQSVRPGRRMRVTAGNCPVCGKDTSFFYFSGGFDRFNVDPFDETGFGWCCGSTNRNRAVASVVQSLFAQDSEGAFTEFACEYDVFVSAAHGAIKDALLGFDRTTYADYFEDTPRGQYRNGVRCEDLTHLSFPDSCFDLVLCEHVLEHVGDPEAAFREVARVLRPGGRFIFSIPFEAESGSTQRITPDGTVLMDRKYHKDPIRNGGALVYTDFATADLVSRYIEPAGLRGQIINVEEPLRGVFRSPVVVATRPS